MVLELAGPGPQPTRPAGWPIARLLPVVLVGLIFLAMVPVIGIAYFAAQSNFDTSSRQLNELTVDMIEQRLQAHVEPVRDQLAYISEAVAKGEIDFDDREQWRSFALGTLAAAPQAVGFVVIPVEGEPVRFTRADRSMRPERRENLSFTNALFAQARTLNGPQWAEPQWSLIVGEPILPIIVPIRVRGQFRGVIGAAIGTSDLSRFLKSLELAGERKPFILAGRDKVLAHPWLGKEQGSAEQRARGRLSKLDEVNDPVLAAMWAPEPNEISWLSGGGSTVSGHWNWVGDRSHGWIYRQIDDYRPASLIIGYHLAGREFGVGALDRARHPDRGRRADAADGDHRHRGRPPAVAADPGARRCRPLGRAAGAREGPAARRQQDPRAQPGEPRLRAHGGRAAARRHLPAARPGRAPDRPAGRPAAERRPRHHHPVLRSRRLFRLFARPAGDRDRDLPERPAGPRRSGDRGDRRHHRQVHRRRADGLLGRARTQRRSCARRLPGRAGDGARGRDVQPRAPRRRPRRLPHARRAAYRHGAGRQCRVCRPRRLHRDRRRGERRLAPGTVRPARAAARRGHDRGQRQLPDGGAGRLPLAADRWRAGRCRGRCGAPVAAAGPGRRA